MIYATLLNEHKHVLLNKVAKKQYVEREQESLLRSLLPSQQIKVVTGPRRSGKSTLCEHVIHDQHFAYCNFDDRRLLSSGFDEDAFVQALTADSPDYLFFDEIQTLEHWELMVNRLQREGRNIILTGSNANLLSTELSTHLTGRHVAIPMTPFSFAERLQLPEEGGTGGSLEHYLHHGGFPQLYMDPIDPELYISSLVGDIISKDIIGRYNLRSPEVLYDILRFLYSSVTKEFSYRNIAKQVGHLSVNTIEQYVSYLSQTYLIDELYRYSYSSKERIGTKKKIYTIDNGLLLANTYASTQDLGKKLENVVYQYLKKHSGELYRWSHPQGKSECDFILKQGLKITECVQVCWNLNSDTIKREVQGLHDAMKVFDCTQGTIVTYEPYEGVMPAGVTVVGLEGFLGREG